MDNKRWGGFGPEQPTNLKISDDLPLTNTTAATRYMKLMKYSIFYQNKTIPPADNISNTTYISVMGV